MLLEEPGDVFLRYSLAHEMASAQEFEPCLQLLGQLCEELPPYVPAFFRSAQILVELDRIESAREFLRSGIETARTQGDLHAAAEMSELLSELGVRG